jgi:hypothetical protein
LSTFDAIEKKSAQAATTPQRATDVAANAATAGQIIKFGESRPQRDLDAQDQIIKLGEDSTSRGNG